MSRLTIAERAQLRAEAAALVERDWMEPDTWTSHPTHDRPWSPEQVEHRISERMWDIRERRKRDARNARQAARWTLQRETEARETRLRRLAAAWRDAPAERRQWPEAEILRVLAEGHRQDVVDIVRAIAARIDPMAATG